jgi:DNA-binding XRE family transcriptional regulator
MRTLNVHTQFYETVKNRLLELTEEDRADVAELFPLLEDDDDEEREAAVVALLDIIWPSAATIERMNVGGAAGDLAGWLEYVSARIRDERQAAKMSQDELAERSGIPQSHISRLENGKHSPTRLTLEKIAGALGVELKRLDPSG